MFNRNDVNPLLGMREQHQLFEDSRGSNKSFIRLLLDRIVPALSRKQKTKDEEKALETDAGANERLPAQHLGSTVSKPGNQAPPVAPPEQQMAHADPILESARPSLFWTIWQKHDRDQPKKHVLNIAAVQSVVVRRQQESLVAAYKTMLEGKRDELLPGLIHEYCKYPQLLSKCTRMILMSQFMQALQSVTQNSSTKPHDEQGSTTIRSYCRRLVKWRERSCSNTESYPTKRIYHLRPIEIVQGSRRCQPFRHASDISAWASH